MPAATTTHRLAPVLLLAAACGRSEPVPAATEPLVLTSFYPLTYFAQRIAGDKVPVESPLPADADPVTWRPAREDVAAFHNATLTLVNGASFEGWVDKVSLPQSRVVDTSHGLKDRLLKFESVTHSHGGGGAHTHEGTDGHTWLDPLNAKVQAQAIHDALAKAFPAHAAAFAQGLAALHQDLDALHARLQAVTPKLGDTRLLASHPAYNYLAARYGWKVTNLDLDPDADLDAPARKSVTDALADAKHAILLWEAAPNEATVAALRELGVRHVLFSPAENLAAAERSAGTDYLAIMRANIDRLEQACR